MATFTWTAGSGNFSASANWFDTADGSTGVPGMFDTAILPGSSLYTVTMDADAVINNLIMTDLQATLAVGAQTFSVLASGTAAAIGGKVTLGDNLLDAGGNFDGSSGSLSNGAAGRITGFGNVSFGSITGSGIFEASVAGQTLMLSGAIDSSVTNMRIDAGATLEIGAGSVAAGATVTFKSGLTGTTLSFSGGIASGKIDAFSGTISGMTVGTAPTPTGTNEIDLTTIASGNITSASLNTTTDVITVNTSGGNFTLQLSGSYSAGTNVLDVADSGGSGTDLFLSTACYCRGTLIETPVGEVRIEELVIGDLVKTLSGEAKPIRWIGRRAYDGRFIVGNKQALPICITAGALANGVPARDLHTSPGHALYIDGVLVPVEHLVNGATIVQSQHVERVEYFHIELDAHDVIFAEGAPAETYTNCDNRYMFANGGEYAALYPDDRPSWNFCAPRLEWADDELTEIRVALLWRAAALGHDGDDDPEPYLIVGGHMVRPECAPDLYRFTVQAGIRDVLLASRVGVPAETDAASRDLRRLGMPVERIVLYNDELYVEAPHTYPALTDGFHGAEPTHRWTDGLARIPEALLQLFTGPVTIELQLAARGLVYRTPTAAAAAA